MAKLKESFSTANDAVNVYQKTLGNYSYCWTYHNEDGKKHSAVFRWNESNSKKTFRPVTCNDDGTWFLGSANENIPLYRLYELCKQINETIYVCEGEKAADAANQIGLLATTSQGGSSAASKTDWRPLAGRTVFILPDNDKPGAKYAEDVASLVTKLRPPARTKILSIPTIKAIGKGADIADCIQSIKETEVTK